MKLLLTMKETVDIVSMSESKIRRLITDKRFPAPVNIDGNVRFRMRDLKDWENNLGVEQTLSPVQHVKRGRPRLAV